MLTVITVVISRRTFQEYFLHSQFPQQLSVWANILWYLVGPFILVTLNGKMYLDLLENANILVLIKRYLSDNFERDIPRKALTFTVFVCNRLFVRYLKTCINALYTSVTSTFPKSSILWENFSAVPLWPQEVDGEYFKILINWI